MKDPCKGCEYQKSLGDGATFYCAYLEIVGHRRPCPPGEECTVKKMPAPRIDWAAARKAYDSGALDREIADAAGCSIASVIKWRAREGLTSNYALRAKAKREARRADYAKK